MDDRLSAYVTNLDRDVFALRNLPEEVVAVLFAYYSRSRDDLRTNLRRLLDDEELAMLEGHAVAPSLATARDKAVRLIRNARSAGAAVARNQALAAAKGAARVLAIGDGLHTDIKGANNAGLDALFIADGVHGEELTPFTPARL